MADLGARRQAETGSRASTKPASGLGPLGFDPARDGSEMLAILLWDFFGPVRPQTIDWIAEGCVPPANKADIKAYRECAKQIAQSLKYTRNI